MLLRPPRAVAPYVLAAALPILFLHVHYQPGFGVRVGATEANAYLSDFALLAVAVAAVARGVRDGFGPLRPGRWLWLAIALFVLWTLVETAYGRHELAGYAWKTHGITAAKFAEYALLAPALPLVARRYEELVPAQWSLALWSAFATAVGIAQFFGARIFLAGTTGRRQASFLSSADFAALSGAALLLGLVLLLVGGDRRVSLIAAVAGGLGVVVAGALAGLLGVLTGAAAAAVALVVRRRLPLRRLVATGAVLALVAAGVVAIRGSDLDAFARFLGASPGSGGGRETKVQTYAHRTLLAYLGVRIWEDHPVLGVGWQGSYEPASFRRYLPDAHRKFPHESPVAFPSASRRYGIQNVYLQALAELGVVGLALWLALFALGLRLAWVGSHVIALGWIGLLLWLWSAQGYVAGIPLDALTWLALGLAAWRPADA